MSYDEQQARKSRVVVETPHSRREVEQSEAIRAPDRSGVSATTVGILVVLVVALVTILVLLLMNNQSTTDVANANFAAQQPSPFPQTTIIEQPAQQQPPIIIQQPAPATQPAPIIVTQPAPAGGAASTGTDDGTIQAAIDKKIADDPTLSALAVVATVFNGKATLTGTVKSESLKSQVEHAVRAVRGVKEIDNQIIVTA